VRTFIVIRDARAPPDHAPHPLELHGGTMVRRAYAQRSVSKCCCPTSKGGKPEPGEAPGDRPDGNAGEWRKV